MKFGEPLMHNIVKFHVEASRWNKESFGHIGRRKHSLMAHIQCTEQVNGFSPISQLKDSEENLKQELDDVLKQEETMWYQRFRSQWIMDGDRNTKYYHRATKARHR
ncbi:hypothetical protein V6N11_018623 [Hibiscus sabdariffa]